MACAQINNLGKGVKRLHPNGIVEVHELMLLKKLSQTIKVNDWGCRHMTKGAMKKWRPSDEDIPSLVESVKFWQLCQPKRPENEWGALDYKLSREATMKEEACMKLLKKCPSMRFRYSNIVKI
tara:strand:+ start:70 stop:438 length:369 start_codon:yes stop_codon:yes gene_type:complete